MLPGEYDSDVSLFITLYRSVYTRYLSLVRFEWLASTLAILTALTLVILSSIAIYYLLFKIFGMTPSSSSNV